MVLAIDTTRATGVPVYFYEEAALRPERKRLEVVRKGQYEALKTEITNPQRQPDIGEPSLHASAGTTVIGARKFLIAFNVNLGTDNLKVAQEIANAVRSSSGGFCHVKGLGVALREQGLVQASMNIVDYEKTLCTVSWNSSEWRPNDGECRSWKQRFTAWFPLPRFSIGNYSDPP